MHNDNLYIMIFTISYLSGFVYSDVPHVECPYEVEYLPESTDKTVQCRIFANPALNLSTVHWEWLAGKDSITLSPGDEAYSSVSSSISQVSCRL